MSSGFGVPSKADAFVRFTMQAWESRFEKNSSNMSLSNQNVSSGETIACFIVAGQSLSANCNGNPGDASYVPTNLAKCDHINIDDGGVYTCKEPMLGGETANGGKSIFIRLADKLISAGYRQRVVLINIGIGGTTAAQWNDELWPRIIIANERALAKGFTVNAVLWQQGESDNMASTSQSSYQGYVGSVINKTRIGGVSAPWILAKSTKYFGADYMPVRYAIDQLVNGVDILLGPDNDALNGANRIADNTHMSVPTGVDASATLWRNSIQSLLP